MADVAAATDDLERPADASASREADHPSLEAWFEQILASGVLGDLDDGHRSAMVAVVAQAAKQGREAESRMDNLVWVGLVVALVVPAVLLAVAWDSGPLWIVAFLVAEFVAVIVHLVMSVTLVSSGLAAAVVGIGTMVLALIVGGLIIVGDESPSIAVQLVIAASLFWAVETLWVVVLAMGEWIDARVHTDDPLADLIYGLVLALRRLPRTRAAAGMGNVVGASAEVEDGLVWPLAERRKIAAALAGSAGTAQQSLGRLSQNRDARAALTARGARIAAWFRAREAEILMPSPAAPAEVEAKLAVALVAACEGRWSELEAEPAPTTPLSLARRLAPRMAVVVPLAAVAVALPSLLSGVLSADEIERIQVALLIGVAGALVAAPGPAVSGTIQDVRERLFK